MQGMPSMEVESMYDQAVKYLVGERVRRDPTRGLQLLREAANRGHPGAAWDLSSCRHLAAAADAGLDPSSSSSSSSSSSTSSSHSFYDDGDDGRCVIDWQRAIKTYQAHAVHNHPIAFTNLARCYRYARGVPKDMKKAVDYLQRAADLGYSLAQNGLAVCYENGWGVDADFGRALELYKKAAEGGYYRALYNMGVCHENGEGVPRDSAKAVEMFEQAASLGYYAALVTLGDCYMEGKGKEQNKQKAVELYTRAAEQGDPEGLFSLAGCYLHGLGVEMDIAKALDLYGQSGKQGHASALIRLGYLYHFGMAEPGGEEHQGQSLERDLRRAFECYKQCALMGDNMGIQLLYHLLNNDFVEKSEQGYATSSLFQMCCSKVNRMLEDQILNDIQQQSDQEDQQQQGQSAGTEQRASLCGKSEFEMQVIRLLPGEVRERLHTEKRVCERMGCKRAFYGEGRMRRTFYQRAPKPKSARGAAADEPEGAAATTESHADGGLGQTTAPPAVAATATPQAAASEAVAGDENGRAGPEAEAAAAAAASQVAVQGEPVHLCFCSKECWATFPQTFEEAMRNAMSLP